jgi:hypothetical protein
VIQFDFSNSISFEFIGFPLKEKETFAVNPLSSTPHPITASLHSLLPSRSSEAEGEEGEGEETEEKRSKSAIKG